MVANETNWKLIAAFTGFTLGFGLLTGWTAIQQTVSIKAPLKNTYLYLVWGEFISSIVIAIVGVVSSDTLLGGESVPGFFPYILITILLTVQEQCYLQIIINRASLMAPNKRLLSRIRWGTAVFMTLLQVSVLSLWYPAELNIYPFHTLLKYCDHISKAILFIVDMLLNYWFVRVVQTYLEKKPDRYEYASICRFQLFLMSTSLMLDCLLLGFSSLRNPILYLQSHPVAYIAKLNMEMSMANLVARLTRGSDFDEDWLFIPPSAFSKGEPGKFLALNKTLYHHSTTLFIPNNSRPVRSVITASPTDEVAARREEISGLRATKDVLVTVEQYEDETGILRAKRPLRRPRSEASLGEMDIQAWHSSEPSKLRLDTEIFDHLNGPEFKSRTNHGR